MTKHNDLVNVLLENYPIIDRLACVYCGMDITFPSGIAIAEKSLANFRPDITILDSEGKPRGTIEVIDTNSPTPAKLASQEKLSFAYFFHVDGYCYCSIWCYQNRDTPRLCDMPTCEECGRLIYTLGFGTHGLVDWEGSFDGGTCLECAARRTGGQWRTPGELALGNLEDRLPGKDVTIIERFLLFSDADFWAKVWSTRTGQLTWSRSSESATSARLTQVEAAFKRGDWENGQRLLHPIGAPRWDWDEEQGPRLFAWEHGNCVRTALAWRQLREHRLGCLPLSIQECVRTRPGLPDVVTNPEEIIVTHGGFPDGRFTACGIDRQNIDKPIQIAMDEMPSCPECR